MTGYRRDSAPCPLDSASTAGPIGAPWSGTPVTARCAPAGTTETLVATATDPVDGRPGYRLEPAGG